MILLTAGRFQVAASHCAASASLASCSSKTHWYIAFHADKNKKRSNNLMQVTRLSQFFSARISNRAGIFILRLPYTDIWVHWSFGSSLRDVSALKPESFAKPPGTGFHTADGILFCTVVISQFVLVLVWTYPRNDFAENCPRRQAKANESWKLLR